MPCSIAFYIGDLSIHGFTYPWDPGTNPPGTTEVLGESKALCEFSTVWDFSALNSCIVQGLTIYIR